MSGDRVQSRGGKVYRRDGRAVTWEQRHWRDYPAPTPQPSPCKIWGGVLDKDGYGVTAKRDGSGRRIKITAHRWIYEAVHGPLPPGYVVRHKCDNPPCFNIKHLEAGTTAENNEDARERGHLGPAWKLTPSQIREMFEIWESGEYSKRELARHFGVSDYAIRTYIKRGRDGFPTVWAERVSAPRKPRRLKHSDWRNRE